MEATIRKQRRRMLFVLAGVAAASFVVTGWIGQNYPLFHTLVELMVAVVALAVFMIAWHARSFADSDYLTFIGLASLPVGVVTVLHALAYKGMPVFPGYDANLPTQLWIIARLAQGTAFLIAPVFLIRRLRAPVVPLAVYVAATTLAVWASFAGAFPAAFVEGQGLTPFKVGMEYLVIGMTVVGAAGLYRYRRNIASDIAPLLWASMACTVLAELAFTLYNDPFGPANRAGHAAHFAAYLLIYGALVQSSLERPVESLFHLLKQREAELAQAYSVEHEISETLQDAMAVQPERVPGLRFDHRYLPAPGAGRIGGDFYDIFLIEDELVGFAIGDVCGKGIKAATTTMKTRSALRAVALEDPEPSRVLEAVNGYLMRELESDSFVTAAFGTIDTAAGRVRLAVAGHPEPVVCGRPDLVLPEGHRAPPLGVLPVLGARTWELELRDGENIVLVTDGVLEARGADSQFGVERLLELLHSIPCGAIPDETIDGVLDALKAHCGGDELGDDVAIVALQLAR